MVRAELPVFQAAEGLALVVNRSADGGVEAGNDSGVGTAHLGLGLKGLEPHESQELVDEQGRVRVAADRPREGSLKVKVDDARFGGRSRERPRVGSSFGVDGRAMNTGADR